MQKTKTSYTKHPLRGENNASTLQRPWIETPLIESKALSLSANCRVFLKLEFLQPSGSFKSRGIGNLILEHIKHHDGTPNSSSRDKPLHFYSSSGGNAGIACVTAARALKHKASVVVPLSTKPSMIAKIKAAGAFQVIQYGESWFYADLHLRQEILKSVAEKGEEEGIYVPPFDDPRIWQGVSTMVGELQRQLPRASAGQAMPPDAIILSVGGGGLFCGIMLGLDQLNWAHVPVVAMETKGADSLAQSLQAGKLVTLPAITSIATSLGAVRVADQTFQYARRDNVKSVVVDDAEAIKGVCCLADEEGFLVPPACGVSVTPCCDGDKLREMVGPLGPDSVVVVVVCGGNDVSMETVEGWRKEYLSG